MAYTQAQLAQYALNIAVAAQQQLITGQAESPSKAGQILLYSTVILLCEAILNAGGPPSMPASLLTGKYSAAQSANTPVQT
jgi:hypothetical protein